jgi:hypothetical protein
MKSKGDWRRNSGQELMSDWGEAPRLLSMGSAEHRATGRKAFGSGSLRSSLDTLGGEASSEELLLSKKMKIVGACASAASDSPRDQMCAEIGFLADSRDRRNTAGEESHAAGLSQMV